MQARTWHPLQLLAPNLESEGCDPEQVLPDDRPHVDLVLRRLKKIRDAQDGGGSVDTPTAAEAAAATSGASEPAQAQRSGSTGKPCTRAL